MASEDDEKELELKDLIIQTLEANGILPKLKVIFKKIFLRKEKICKKILTLIGTNKIKCFYSY